MLLMLLTACEAENPYAGCTLDEVALTEDGAVDYEGRYVYGDDGHRTSLLVTGDGWEQAAAYTWEGDCNTLLVTDTTTDSLHSTETVRTTCDRFDDPVRTEEESVGIGSDGTEETNRSVTTYANRHDAAGRLVRYERSDDGRPSFTAEQAWGICDDPVLTRLRTPDGVTGENAVTCRLDGQPTEEVSVAFDADGAEGGTLRITWEYDADGRWTRETLDTGEGTRVQSFFEAAWADPDAPGPTLIERFRDGVVNGTWTRAYDCPS